MLSCLRISLGLFLCSATLCSGEPTLIKLEPPQLSVETLSEKTACTRPMRAGKFNISVEKHAGKTIVNCYGHGGSGWTTLFGSVGKAIELFKTTNTHPDTPIRVIGSGCMGLTTAIELTRLGYHVVGISTKSLYDITSWRAAGYLALVSVKTSPEEQADLNKIGLNTFLTYQKIDRGLHPYISQEAVRYMPVFCSIDTESGVEDLEAQGMIPPKEYVTLDFGNGVTHPNYIKYMTYFMNPGILMRQLTAEVARLNIAVEIKTIHSFDEVAEEVIFNCSGLGARELNSDVNMIPVRGHLIALNNRAGTGHMDYMIYTKVEQDGKEEYIYLFPKTLSVTPENTEGVAIVGVVGGTFIPQADTLTQSDLEQLDQLEFKRMLDRNSVFFHGHPFNE